MKTHPRFTSIAALAIVFIAFVALAGCSGSSGSETQAGNQSSAAKEDSAAVGQDADATEESTLYTPTYESNGKETAVIKTSKGDITVELYGKEAPIHVANFIELALKGFYDGTKFHRYVPGFVVQGGDPNTKEYSAADVREMAPRQEQGQVKDGEKVLGTGGPDYMIKGEFDPAQNPQKHVEGALGMARSQSPDSAGSQFYFALQPLPQLDGQYTVFGTITDGLDVMKELRIGDEIESIEIRGAAE